MFHGFQYALTLQVFVEKLFLIDNFFNANSFAMYRIYGIFLKANICRQCKQFARFTGQRIQECHFSQEGERPVKHSEFSKETLGSASEEESILRHTVIVAHTADKREE